MTSFGVASSSLKRHLLQLVLVVLLVLLDTVITTSTPYLCPKGCECNDASITCTSVAGLRSIDKSLPIKRLVLSGLELKKIPAQLENIRNITELDLSNNHLSEVNHLGRRIRRLNLSQNRITSGKLSKVPLFVESLNLSHNDITYLPLYLMKLKKLRYIELADNPINCTCETLHIRNWLTTRHVWSDQHIKCSAPHEFKGRPWLQVKQSDVCNGIGGRDGGYNWDDYEDENDLMLGDQADLEDDEQEDEDDFKKEYFPVGEKVKPQDPPIEIQNDEELDDGSGDSLSLDIGEEEKAEARKVVDLPISEGSGGINNDSRQYVRLSQMQHGGKEDDDDEGSGSGGGVLFTGVRAINIDETSEGPKTVNEFDEGEESEEKPITSPDGGLGIFGKGLEDDTTVSHGTESTEGIVPFKAAVEVDKDTTSAAESSTEKENAYIVNEPNRADSGSKDIYFLFTAVGIVVLLLILLVIYNRKKEKRNRRGKADLETARGRELQDMDKSLLGKPLEKNGHKAPELAPLMNDNDKTDYQKVFNDKPNNYAPVKPERTSLEKPVMETFKPVPADRNKSKESLYENVPLNDNNNTVPLQNGNGHLHNGELAGVHQPQHNVPSQDDEVFLPPNGNPNHLQPESIESPKPKRYSPIYVPTSPKSDRYSPVYSPETGRVKIKLTETPKPKTPVLVTRSRSRAGDYITTTDQKF